MSNKLLSVVDEPSLLGTLVYNLLLEGRLDRADIDLKGSTTSWKKR